MRFWLALHLAAAAAGWEAPAGNGEEVCENKGYNRSECVAIGCCHFNPSDDHDQCWSDVGDGPCSDGRGPPAVLLSGVVGWADGAVLWHDPPSGWEACHKVWGHLFTL